MIFISAGHYPQRPGAGYKGFFEYDEAVLWRRDIFDAIFNRQATDNVIAFEVPTGVLREKIDYINHRTDDHSIAIEIHFNAAVDSSGNNIGKGHESLYFPGSDKSKHLAKQVNEALSDYFKPDRGVKEGWYRMDKRNGPDYFLERTSCPSAIIEPEFIQHRESIREHRREACDLIAAVLLMVHADFGGEV